MNGNENRPQPSQGAEKAREIGLFLLRSLANNWGFKLLALLLAIVLWAGLITQDPTLTREKTFTDVTISVSGSDAIKRNGFIVVSDLTNELEKATLRVDVPQMQYKNAQVNFYNVRIDLSRITQAGRQELRVLSTNSSTYGNVSEVTPATVEVDVEEYITRYRIPVSVDSVGTPPAGFYAGQPSVDPPMVAVSGPRSLVEKVVRAEAVVEQGSLPAREGLVRTAVPFRLLDELGNPVESRLLEVTSESVLLDSVLVEQNLYSVKDINMSDVGLVTGKPAEGYEIKSVTFMPEIITVAGRASSLELLDTLYVDESVDVTGQSQTIQRHLRVRHPSELVQMSSENVTVVVEIGPVIRRHSFEDVRVNITGAADDLRATSNVKTADVVVQGPQLWVSALRGRDITLTCDASGLAVGVYDLPVICQVEGAEDQPYSVETEPETIRVTVSAK